MSRYSEHKAYGFKCIKFSWGWRISWTIDRYYQHSMLRFPTGFHRNTDEHGARRFCKKHGLEFPQ